MSTGRIKKKYSEKFRKPLGVTGIPDNDELKYLEKVILGSSSKIFENSISEEESDEEVSSKKPRQEQSEKQPAWIDEDDSLTHKEVLYLKRKSNKMANAASEKDYKTITKKKFQSIMGVPKWAKAPSKNDNSAYSLNNCGKFIKKPKHLVKGVLEFKKLRHLNYETTAEGPNVNVVKFHPKSTVAMVAGLSGLVSLFQVDGKQNTKLQSIQFKKYPINCGSFLKNGEEFLLGSQHYKFFQCHNLMTGKSFRVDHGKLANITKTKNFCVSPNDELIALCGSSGKIFLFAASTKEYVDCLQMNSNVTAVSFNADGSFLYSHGDDGEVYIWDMKSRTCMKKFYDEGCLRGMSISVSKDDQFIACGCSSGIVNIYDHDTVFLEEKTLPVKTIYSLVTAANSALFNSTGEVLAVASGEKENAIKLVHCPTMSVFSNFPDFRSKIKRPLCVDFSPNSGFFAVGDSNGVAHLYRLKHYGNY